MNQENVLGGLNGDNSPERASMRRAEVDSSLLTWVDYFPDEHRLQLGFRSGEVWDYFDVPDSTYRGLLEAESKGGYFNQQIRRRFRDQRIRHFDAT
jgi:hypothetical protein